MRGSSVGASSRDRDPFNPMRHFSGFSSHYVPPSLVHRTSVENDGDNADDDDDDASLSDDDVVPSSEGEDLLIPHHTHAFNHELRESATKTTQEEL